MLETLKFRIDSASAGKRLDKFLFENIGSVSRMFLHDLIERNSCFVNGEKQPRGYHLRENDAVEISLETETETAMKPENLPLEILFEDAEILVVEKPAGMLVHPTKRIKTGTLANALVFHLNFSRYRDIEESENVQSKIQNLKSKIIRPGIVHRLDKETSGLLVIAKTERALRILSSHFQRQLVKKMYLAVVEGIVGEDEGAINAPISRVDDEKPHWRVAENGKKAESHFRVLERKENLTLLELEPVTGRTNQLRIHCALIGHPIVGDEWYGAQKASRLCLHAARLAFFHPNGGWLKFESKLPEAILKEFTCRNKPTKD